MEQTVQEQRRALQLLAVIDKKTQALRDLLTVPGSVPEPEPEPDKPKPGPDGRHSVKVDCSLGMFSAMGIGEGLHLRSIGALSIATLIDSSGVYVCLMNPFIGDGVAKWSNLVITVDGATVSVPGVQALTGGRMLPYFFRSTLSPFGTHTGPEAQKELLKQLDKGVVAGGFGQWNGVEIFGWNANKDRPKNANEGGGWLIYPHIGYWEDHPQGRELSHRIMLGQASRMSIFRYNRKAWLRGELVHAKEPKTKRYIGCGAQQLPGYTWFRTVDDQMNDLDHEHFGRATGVVDRHVARGSTFAALIQNAMHEDVRIRWTSPLEAASDQLGRSFGQSLIAAVRYGQATGDGSTARSLAKVAMELQRPDGHVYFIPGGTSKWRKKIGAKQKKNGGFLEPVEFYEDRGSPGLVVAFEAQIVLLGLTMASDLLGIGDAAYVAEGLADALGPFPPEVIFPDEPGLNPDRLQGWGHMLEPFKELAGVSLGQQAQHYPIGDGACGAAHPSLWD